MPGAAHFWGSWAAISIPEGNQTVPKTKNKLHLDLRIGEDDVDTVVAKLIERGGPHKTG